MSDSSACHGLVCIQVACDMLEASWMFYETHEHNTCHNWEKLLNKMSHTRIDIDMGSCGLNQRGYSISSPVFSGEVGARAGGEQYHEECSGKTIRYMGCMGIPECFLVKSGVQENFTAPGNQNPTDDYNPDPCSTVELTRIRTIRRGIKNTRLC